MMKKIRKALGYFESNKSSLVALTGIVVSVCFGSILLIPLISRYNEGKSEEENIRIRLTKLQEKYDFLETVQLSYYQEVFPKVQYVLPDSKDFVSLFSTLDGLQEKTGVKITRSDFQLGVVSSPSKNFKKSAYAPAYVLPLHVELQGSGGQIRNFLSRLTGIAGRFLTIDAVEWGEIEENGIWNVKLTGQAFFSMQSTRIGAIDTPLSPLGEDEGKIAEEIAQTVSFDTSQSGDVPIGKTDIFQ